MGLITSVSSTSHGNSWYSLGKGHMDDGWLSTLVHTMINHFNTANIGATVLQGERFTMQPDEMRWTSVRPTFLRFYCQPPNFNDFWLVNNMDKAVLRQSGIYFQAYVQCGLECLVTMDIWSNNRFGLPLAQVIRQSFFWGQVRSWEHYSPPDNSLFSNGRGCDTKAVHPIQRA